MDKMDKTDKTQKAQTFVITEGNQSLEMYGVSPKTDCPHFNEQQAQELDKLLDQQKEKIFVLPCKDCQNIGENWVCCSCSGIFCSRYVQGHMASHNTNIKHPIALSFSDLSFWCYECDSYITSSVLNYIRTKFSALKFPDEKKQMGELKELFNELCISKDKAEKIQQEDKKEDLDQEEKNINEEQKIQVKEDDKDIKEKVEEKKEEKVKFEYKDLLDGLKKKTYKNIAFLTGAGISVNAGIPDFRTPGTGLYYKLEKYHLEYPEQIFDIDYFVKNPQPFYQLMNEFQIQGFIPTVAHYFQSYLLQRNQVIQIFTQNIDSLEQKAGALNEKIIQAHGHMNSAHCIKCHKEQNIQTFMEKAKKLEIFKCSCDGLIKPDIVFFGEALPKAFFQKIDLLKKADLIIIMGTSLVVQPFASLVDLAPEDTPIILINRENSLTSFDEPKNFLFLGGDIDQNIKKLIKDLDWNTDFGTFMQKFEKEKSQPIKL